MGSPRSSSVVARGDGCDRAVQSGSDGNISSGKSEFLRKRNSKEGEE
jgi:hypothetical protein